MSQDQGKQSKKPMTAEQVGNYLAEIRKNARKDAKGREMPAPIYSDPKQIRSELLALLEYHLPPSPGKTLLRMRIKGESLSNIAIAYRVPLQVLERVEQVTMETWMKAVEKFPAYEILQPGEKKILIAKPA